MLLLLAAILFIYFSCCCCCHYHILYIAALAGFVVVLYALLLLLVLLSLLKFGSAFMAAYNAYVCMDLCVRMFLYFDSSIWFFVYIFFISCPSAPCVPISFLYQIMPSLFTSALMLTMSHREPSFFSSNVLFPQFSNNYYNNILL